MKLTYFSCFRFQDARLHVYTKLRITFDFFYCYTRTNISTSTRPTRSNSGNGLFSFRTRGDNYIHYSQRPLSATATQWRFVSMIVDCLFTVKYGRKGVLNFEIVVLMFVDWKERRLLQWKCSYDNDLFDWLRDKDVTCL